jgi:hypothetical protein
MAELRTGFLDLPGELRNRIYGYFLEVEGHQLPVGPTRESVMTQVGALPIPPAFISLTRLSLANRQVYHEVRSYFFTTVLPHIQFVVYEPAALTPLVDIIPPEALENLYLVMQFSDEVEFSVMGDVLRLIAGEFGFNNIHTLSVSGLDWAKHDVVHPIPEEAEEQDQIDFSPGGRFLMRVRWKVNHERSPYRPWYISLEGWVGALECFEQLVDCLRGVR